MANHPPSLAEACHENQKAPTAHLITLLDQVADRFPDHDAIISLHQSRLRWTFAQLQEKSIQLAARLSSRGVGRGSRIVTLMYNQAQWALLFWASARLGCQFVPLDPRVLDRDARDVLFLLEQLQPEAMFVSNEAMANRINHITIDHDHRPLVQCVVADNEETGVPAGWTTVSKIMSEPLHDEPSLHRPGNPDDTILILFTSGTTALPKGCPHTTISISAQGLGFMYGLGLGPGANLCQHLPNFHIFNIAFTLAFWLAGATVIFPSLSFDPQSTLQLLGSYQRVTVPCVPAMIHALLSCAPPQQSSPPSFEVLLGGAPVTLDVVKRCRDLGATRVMIGYGMTEGIPFINTSLEETSVDLTTRDVSVGKVFYGGRARICAEGSRIPIHKEEIGEVHLGGLPVFGGYLGGRSNDSCYCENGVNWIATGDQGYMDREGYVYILGRYKDLIICGGENISPLKIEQCLSEVDGIRDVYVVGAPDAVVGEVPVAVMRKDPSGQLPVKTALQTMVSNKLGQSFAPARILDLQDDLGKDHYPTTTSGKIQKIVLREWVTEHLNQITVDNPVSFGNDLTAELTTLCSGLTGLAPGDIDRDASIRSFADSMMQIQFCHLIGQKLQLVVTQMDLIKFNTIRKLAKLLHERKHAKDSRFRDTDCASPAQLDMERAKQVALSKLSGLGFRWDDVEEVVPIADCVKRTHYGHRPNSWNTRMSWIASPSISVTDIKAALHTWLQRHPLLRSTPLTYDEKLDLYLVMRPSEDWMKLQVVDGGMVGDINSVETYKLNDADYDHIDGKGPLFRATILSVEKPSVVGLVMHLHHLVFDAHILFRWFEDLKNLLKCKDQLFNFHPYRDYIADYQGNRTGPAARRAIDFHVSKIRGVSSATDAFWPRQIAPCWLKGDNQGWVHSDHTPGHPSERPLLDGDKSIGTRGITRAVHVPKISELQRKFAITPPTIARCACALINVRMTGAKEAIFGLVESGRTWPSADDSHPANRGVDILEVDGPTIVQCLSRTTITPDETAIQLLTRMSKDQDDIVSNTYAPMNEICRKLDETDSKSFLDILFRQSLNWRMGGYKEHASDPIKLVENISRSDFGLFWLPGMMEGDRLRLTVKYDDAQLRATDVYNIMTEFLCAVAWLGDPGNVDKPVSQCEFQGRDIVDLDHEGPARYRR
ncbi:AMP-binding enzyme family protein [Aspergillus brunneoviolaceus CBS 621.78]|uniref:AMP-binding enzyme family protein n=1 Tax=Aspergillus brunneoviolaceus CBS 621.78 TaxID=1450534 RepID=A0ACD1FTH6_9EURO|nr:AMP-binding enzyme family protein [Aspergillus brunneoviolaceus CBS 621.78]RAH40259.1 AMP-binding enzyme family protein [Aspergillus brunneoviolaceus CBS 621.78]